MVMHMGGHQRLAQTALVFVMFTAACDNGEKTKAKIAEIQKQADEKIAQAERSANEKLAALQQQMEATKAELVDAAAQVKAEANDAINKAQANADEAAKAAAAALARARQAYKEEGRQQLNALNKEATDINAKIAKATATVKTTAQKSMLKVAEEQKAIQKDIEAFDTATLNTFKAAKAQMDKDVASLKATLKNARAKLPQP
jgi:hypothetical protein